MVWKGDFDKRSVDSSARITVAKAFERKMLPWKDSTDVGMQQLCKFKYCILVLFFTSQDLEVSVEINMLIITLLEKIIWLNFQERLGIKENWSFFSLGDLSV